MIVAGDYGNDGSSYNMSDELLFFCNVAVFYEFRKPLFQPGPLPRALTTSNCDSLSTGIF